MMASDQEEMAAAAEVSKPANKKGKKDRKSKKEAELEEAQRELEAIAAGDDLVQDEKGNKDIFD